MDITIDVEDSKLNLIAAGVIDMYNNKEIVLTVNSGVGKRSEIIR